MNKMNIKPMFSIEQRKIKGKTMFTLNKTQLYTHRDGTLWIGRTFKINFPTLEMAVEKLEYYERYAANGDRWLAQIESYCRTQVS